MTQDTRLTKERRVPRTASRMCVLSTFHFLLTSWQIWRFAHRIQVILNSKKPKIGFLSLNNHAIGQNLINFPLTRFVDYKAQ